MAQTFRRLLLPALIVGSLLGAPLLGYAQSGGRYYPETGHTLAPEFVRYFDANGGVAIFGYPITEAFRDPETGTLLQYTENARFEWDEGEDQVRLAPLGEILGGWHVPAEDPQAEGRGCRYFEASGQSTCFAFLSFFQENGGEDLFGLPISDFIIQNDRIVQYFQYFRLDWYPEAGGDEQVRIAPLGREHFQTEGFDPSLLRPTGRGGEGEYRVTELRPSASVNQPSVTIGAEQEIYLVVRDQNSLPVEGAAALLIARFPERDRYFLMPPTDEDGVSRRNLPLDGTSVAGPVNLEIWVLHAGLEEVARDSFTIR